MCSADLGDTQNLRERGTHSELEGDRGERDNQNLRERERHSEPEGERG